MQIEEIKELDTLQTRLKLLEDRVTDHSINLIEILSNVKFFGNLKKERCRFAKGGQCERYLLDLEAAKKIPIALRCRIDKCNLKSDHCHLELSHLGCALCPDYSTESL
jgi:hypothetical protein